VLGNRDLIKLASERDDVDEEDLDSIIAHIDDYAV